ncbi:toll/interleukin-1 receptor domain-containing protein [Tardiphaga sp. 367_B4_N1_1]|uniref:toll/interleukin-1 receptor domain-containing protein n=1 Tax=Tardiphaga sp. 367_B4_N1_1 TaxID=3240777 RepID=UPI003F22E42A
MLEFRGGGRRVSQNAFFENLQNEAIEAGMKQLEQQVHDTAASIIDPETGKHAEVFVRRRSPTELTLRTHGSPAFVRELEKRLGVEAGSIETMSTQTTNDVPRVYLAHASEDHDTLAKPLAQALMASGIEVWFDEWEILTGDSLRRKMEEGLANSTHFVVLLTPNSLHKPWVETEIDVGFIRAVGGEARFMGIRAGVDVNDLSPFLRTLRCPEVHLDRKGDVDGLIADIHGISRKPERGSAPRYVKTLPEGLKGWSASAVAIAEHLVRSSELGRKFDPQVTVASVARATGLPEEDIRLGALDLMGNGLVEETKEIGSDRFWPTNSLFVEFDQYFLDFTPRQDAVAVANWLVSEKVEAIEIKILAEKFPNWQARRLNSALSYLDDAKLVHPLKAMDGGPWVMTLLRVTDHTRRFVRDHG